MTERSFVPGARRAVAVVGSGVAGLTAAHVLHSAGCYVTLYEADDRLGATPTPTGVTIASEQKRFIDERIRERWLQDRVMDQGL